MKIPTFQNLTDLKKLYGNQNLIDSRGNFLKKYSNRKYSIRDFLLKILPKFRNRRILDIGCGTGSFLKKLHTIYPNNDYYGLDICQNRECQKLDFLNYDIYNGVHFPQYAQKFDLIFCMHMLYHVGDFNFFFGKLKEILACQGQIVITTKSKFTFPKIESIFLETVNEMKKTERLNVTKYRDESRFCLENGLDILLENFPKNSFLVREYVLETQVWVENLKDLMKYILSTKRYYLIPQMKIKAQKDYLTKWRNRLMQFDVFLDKYIEVIYVISRKD